MLFNSLDFALFLPLIFALFWGLAPLGLRAQNAILLFASYVFYGWWDWRFLGLIALSTLIDFSIGIALGNSKPLRTRRFLLAASVLTNLGLLGVFKYYDFFVDNFVAAFSFFGAPISASSLNIILPVGISFYTFQTLSYSIDIYRGKLTPSRDLIAFAAFVAFFPQLVAGPIERATHLIPQFTAPRKFSYDAAMDGCRQMLWGFFKKTVIADNCAAIANAIFNDSTSLEGSTLLIGALAFTFQIYGDFSGYSDIAIGSARLFGFDLMRNFAFPYFSRDVAEFWRRWHISLSTWFRDYVYIPLGGSRVSLAYCVRNTFIVFIISGIWHGANWTFVVWGFLNAVYFLPLLLAKRHRTHTDTVAEGRLFPSLREVSAMFVTFSFTVFAWIFFRSADMTQALDIVAEIFSPSLFTIPDLPLGSRVKDVAILVAAFMLVEWLGRQQQYGLQVVTAFSQRWQRVIAYYGVIALIAFQGNFARNQFIYFQF